MVDLKCSVVNDSKCWYCENLCNSCLEEVSHSITETTSINEKIVELKFCDRQCSEFYKNIDPKQRIYVFLPHKSSQGNSKDIFSNKEELHKFGTRCAPIFLNHEELLHAYCLSIIDTKLSIEELCFCQGDIAGQNICYAVYSKRGLVEQPISLEFIVSHKYEATELLHYYRCNGEASAAFDGIKSSSSFHELFSVVKATLSHNVA